MNCGLRGSFAFRYVHQRIIVLYIRSRHHQNLADREGLNGYSWFISSSLKRKPVELDASLAATGPLLREILALAASAVRSSFPYEDLSPVGLCDSCSDDKTQYAIRITCIFSRHSLLHLIYS